MVNLRVRQYVEEDGDCGEALYVTYLIFILRSSHASSTSTNVGNAQIVGMFKLYYSKSMYPASKVDNYRCYPNFAALISRAVLDSGVGTARFWHFLLIRFGQNSAGFLPDFIYGKCP
jgi:hypothetical protein